MCSYQPCLENNKYSWAQIEHMYASESVKTVDSGKGKLGSLPKILICHAKESDLISSTAGTVTGQEFSKAPYKKPAVYRHLWCKKGIGIFCTFLGHEAGEAILGNYQGKGSDSNCITLFQAEFLLKDNILWLAFDYHHALAIRKKCHW